MLFLLCVLQLRRVLSAVFNNLTGDCREYKARFFSNVHSRRKEAMDTRRDTRNSDSLERNYFFTMRIWVAQRWQNLHLWRHAEVDRTRLWATCSHMRCFEQETGLVTSRCPRGHFQPSWFCRNTPVQIISAGGKLPKRLSKRSSRGYRSIYVTQTV